MFYALILLTVRQGARNALIQKAIPVANGEAAHPNPQEYADAALESLKGLLKQIMDRRARENCPIINTFPFS